MPNLCLYTGAGADDGAADPGLRKHADSEHAAAAIPAIAFPEQLPCAAAIAMGTSRSPRLPAPR